MEIIKLLKKAIKEKNEQEAKKLIVELFLFNPDNFKKSILMSNCLDEPLTYKTGEEEIEFMNKIFMNSFKEVVDRGQKGIIDVEKMLKVNILIKLPHAIGFIYKISKLNKERLLKNGTKKYNLGQNIKMFSTYFEDQMRLANNKSNTYLTGMENHIASNEAYNVKNVMVSNADNLENLLEIGQTLLKYYYYSHRKELEKKDSEEFEFVTPYRKPEFEELMHLANQRHLLEIVWEKYKYENWEIKTHKKDNDFFYTFAPENKKEFIVDKIAVTRYHYRELINTQKKLWGKKEEMHNAYLKMSEEAKKIGIGDFKSIFKISKEIYSKVSIFAKELIQGQKKSIDSIYFDVKSSGIEMNDYFLCFEYLVTIAMIYNSSILEKFNQYDMQEYDKLSPIIERKNLIEQFSLLYNYEYNVASKIFDMFIFSEKSNLDLFSKPLISIGNTKLIFSANLIIHLNIARAVELIATELKANITKKGINFENDLRNLMSLNKNIQVNRNKIEFLAYDGRNVEFDFIGLFEDYLLLIEFKHSRIPFSGKERHNTLKTLDEGVEQVNRRVNVIKNDWEKIKEKCSFELPEEPIDENRILKIVCTNIFNFTTNIRDGVTIIDSSSLLTFFINPKSEIISLGDELSIIKTKSAWKNETPKVEEFIEYMKCPIAMEPLKKAFTENYKPLFISEEEEKAFILDAVLKEDPYKKYIEKERVNPKKIGRNEQCPCNSGKKYKKCCGR